MPAAFNHTIIASLDGAASAQFYTVLLDAAPAPSWGPFTNISLAAGVMLQFAAPPVDIQPQHYAFLVDDAHFVRALGWLVDHDVPYWADPRMTRPGETKTEHGGRGVYFRDPAGHFLELTTRPYF
ncbi:VOC family protein [Microlunatus capsulatus]|uniref:Catechol 2,3-dioxygenase-like lactoylglutathione lyase family enzyme n=1 Tax=Microlunatus capsulatus TaxID=99117 RepID=A0ABS4Z2R5_9ACTN|nr:VOC family protein [Microlunatus capsulatus]MBP2415338.1 catechol 2,3-dioxygenase-like lactoylglutathione lyase family enzyme [Microlunatus capsulatus]